MPEIASVLLSLLIATAIPLFFLYLLDTLALYGDSSYRTVALCFLWGGVASLLSAAIHHVLIAQLDWITLATLAILITPFVEEISKAAILLYLWRRPTFTHFVDGAVYGFAAGIGFAICENYIYILADIENGLATALGRVLSTNLMHGSASAMVGIAFGLARFRRFSWRTLILLAGLFMAILLHAGFNSIVLRPNSRMLLIYAIIVGVDAAAFIALLVKRGLAQEKQWIEEKLGAADRVTAAEAAAVHRLDQLDNLLEPLAEIFGPAKVDQIEKFLLLQARLGILRKALDRVQERGKMRAALEAQIELLRDEMDDTRRAVGAYPMALLRSLFPPGDYILWSRLQAALQEQATEEDLAATPSLFSVLESRTRQQDP